MSFPNRRFGVPRDSELMVTVQECSNRGLALISGQTTTLLNLSSEENNTLIWLVGCTWRDCTPLLIPQALTLRLNECVIRWTVSALFPSGKSERKSETDTQAVCFHANRLRDSYYKA